MKNSMDANIGGRHFRDDHLLLDDQGVEISRTRVSTAAEAALQLLWGIFR